MGLKERLLKQTWDGSARSCRLRLATGRDGNWDLVDTWTGNAVVSTAPFEDHPVDLSGIWLT